MLYMATTVSESITDLFTPLPLDLFKSETDPDWCPGCGDFGVLRSLQTALAELGIHPEQTLVCSGIGCSSNLPGFIHAYGFHGLHGRTVPVAVGAKLANPDLTVIAAGGDGDGYGIGVGHFIHAARRNINITYIVMDNQIYGLTTGQVSPTSEFDMRTKSSLEGNIEVPINPLALAISAGATFVARGFSGEAKHLADVIKQAILHKGFSLVDVFSPCVTYNKQNTYPWFKERVYKLEETDYNPSDLNTALVKSWEWGAEIPLGVFYKVERPTYEDLEPALRRHGNPMRQQLGLTNTERDKILQEFM